MLHRRMIAQSRILSLPCDPPLAGGASCSAADHQPAPALSAGGKPATKVKAKKAAIRKPVPRPAAKKAGARKAAAKKAVKANPAEVAAPTPVQEQAATV
jgi:hypothetical protein